MNLFYKFSLFSVISILFCGCLEVETTINLNKDGSGTIEEKVLMNSDFAEMLSGFNLKDAEDTTQSGKFTLFKPEELRSDAKNYGEDVKYVSGKEIKENGREGYRAVYSFQNISQLKIDNDPSSKVSVSQTNNQNKEPKEFITFAYSGSNPSELIIKMPKPNFDDSSETTVENKDTTNANNPLAKEFMNLMKDFRFALQLHINGNIKSTNATYVDGSNITLLDVAFDKLLQNKDKLEKLNNLKNQNIDELRKLIKDVPGIKLELNESINVKYD